MLSAFWNISPSKVNALRSLKNSRLLKKNFSSHCTLWHRGALRPISVMSHPRLRLISNLPYWTEEGRWRHYVGYGFNFWPTSDIRIFECPCPCLCPCSCPCPCPCPFLGPSLCLSSCLHSCSCNMNINMSIDANTEMSMDMYVDVDIIRTCMWTWT